MATVSESGHSVPIGDDDDDNNNDNTEWEYEYDETETENFYLSLDLPRVRSRKKKSASASVGARTSIPAAATTNEATDPRSRRSRSPPSGLRVGKKFGKRIQILDLHTENPIISYRNRFYSCHWASTIGTELYLTSTNNPVQCTPLQSHPGFHILGTSGLKVIGRPVDVALQDKLWVDRAAKAPKQPPTVSVEESAIIEPENADTSDKPIRIPIGPEAGRWKYTQARFLECLIATKRKRGETDEVTVHSQKVNAQSGWRSGRYEDEDGEQSESQAEESEDDDDEDEQGVGQTQPQLVNRQKGRRAETKPRRKRRQLTLGGLFRDFKPTANDSEGADIRTVQDQTPRTWDDLSEDSVTESDRGESSNENSEEDDSEEYDDEIIDDA